MPRREAPGRWRRRVDAPSAAAAARWPTTAGRPPPAPRRVPATRASPGPSATADTRGRPTPTPNPALPSAPRSPPWTAPRPVPRPRPAAAVGRAATSRATPLRRPGTSGSPTGRAARGSRGARGPRQRGLRHRGAPTPALRCRRSPEEALLDHLAVYPHVPERTGEDDGAHHVGQEVPPDAVRPQSGAGVHDAEPGRHPDR